MRRARDDRGPAEPRLVGDVRPSGASAVAGRHHLGQEAGGHPEPLEQVARPGPAVASRHCVVVAFVYSETREPPSQ